MRQNREAIIDIGSGKIVALVGTPTPDGSFIVDANSVVACDVFYKGSFISEDVGYSVRQVLDEVQKVLKLKIKEVYVGVPADFCVVATNQTSTAWRKGSVIQKEDVDYLSKRANSFSEARATHLLIDSAPVSFLVDDRIFFRGVEGIFANSFTAEFSYVFVSNYFTSAIEKVLRPSGISVKGYISVPMAQSTYLIDEATRDNTAILVDCGFSSTTIAFVRGNGVFYLDSIPIGGAHISYNLMETMAINDYDTVEMLKGLMNLNLECSENDNYILRGSAIKAKRSNEVVSDVIRQIAKGIESCGKECPYIIPKNVKLFITGGGINYIKGGVKLLGDYFGREFSTVRSHDIKLRYPEYSSSYAVLHKALKITK